MRFLVDECAGPALARWLREQGKDERANNKIAAMERLIAGFADHLNDQFVVVTDTQVQISSPGG